MIHVFGYPDWEAMDDTEAFCCEERDPIVTYHVQPVQTHKGWACRYCGCVGWTEDDRQAS